MTQQLDDATRPRLPKKSGAVSPTGQASQRTLVQIHDHLRHELAQIRTTVESVAQGHRDPQAARSLINRMTMRQNYWSLGAFCASYCRIVSLHHTIEDQHLFTTLRRAEDSLAPVLDRLSAEHEVIADILEQLDQALVSMVDGTSGPADVLHAVDRLSDRLLSHLGYEEDELLDPIGRLSIPI